MEAVHTFGSWIRHRRRALDLTQDALAQQLGYSVVTVRKIESGERRPSREAVARLAEALGIPPEGHAAFLEAARRNPDAVVALAGVQMWPAMPVVAGGSVRWVPDLPAENADTGPASALAGAGSSNPGADVSPSGNSATERATAGVPDASRKASASAGPLSEAGSAPRARWEIAADVSSFVGRERELASLARLLRRPGVRLVTLAGPPGIGKTRLALRFADSLSGDFANGAVYVNLLDAQNADEVTAAVALSLGLREDAGRPLLDMVQAALRSKEMLLVLDNFEQAVEAAQVVNALLAAAPAVKALVTSRVLLDLRGEHVFNVPPLHLPDLLTLHADGDQLVALLETYEAVQLFVERAQARVGDFGLTAQNAPLVAEICRLLDGLPLAIELAAARITTLPPETMLRELAVNRLDPLTVTMRDAPVRQQALRAAFEWSYNLLREGEQRLWRRLSVFGDGFTLEAAQAVCAEDGAGSDSDYGDVAGGLTSLIKASLVRPETAPGGTRYRQLPTIREYGLERLNRSGESETIRRCHADFLTARAEAALALSPSGDAATLDYLEAEHANLTAALDWCHLHEDGAELEMRLACQFCESSGTHAAT